MDLRHRDDIAAFSRAKRRDVLLAHEAVADEADADAVVRAGDAGVRHGGQRRGTGGRVEEGAAMWRDSHAYFPGFRTDSKNR